MTERGDSTGRGGVAGQGESAGRGKSTGRGDVVPGVRDDEEALAACGRLLAILRRLRQPGGCPWDLKQTEKSMAPRILEEAFELADAVEGGDPSKESEEMGDLLMNTFMTGLIAGEAGRYRLKDVFEKIAVKLISRHPHVFGDETDKSVAGILYRWEDIKRGEREENGEDASAVAGVPRAMPGLLRAYRVGEKLRRTGADLPPFRRPVEDAAAAMKKLTAVDLGAAVAGGMEELLGELILALCNAAWIAGVNPEVALRNAVTREENVFRNAEAALGDRLEEASGAEIDAVWRGEATGS
jgi:tetrapyrrole methylase family protein / MazG family protein